MNLGRNQLLGWINQILQCEYANIEMLADGVGFCQLIDAIHPGSINISRINLSTRYPDDCLRNLRILQSAMKKLKINQPASFQKISQGKFQDNITFLQWIYSYSMKYGYENLQLYQPFNRRLQILDKQGKTIQQISPHLVPTQAYFSQQQQQYEQQINQRQRYRQRQRQYDVQQQQYEHNNDQIQIQQKKNEIIDRLSILSQDAKNVQSELKTQMETNWKLMHNVERSIQERNTLYSLLKQIQTIIKQNQSNSIGSEILSIISEVPQDFY